MYFWAGSRPLRGVGQREAPDRIVALFGPVVSLDALDEGLQDLVRTHMIYSPTKADMIEANHPNACNLCHTDRPIDWTLGRLKNWYGKTYDEAKLAASYMDRTRPVALGWLKGTHGAAADSLRVEAISDTEHFDRRMAMVQNLKKALQDSWRQLKDRPTAELLEARFEKLIQYGKFREAEA